jgi:uncharacterized metal-binding protein
MIKSLLAAEFFNRPSMHIETSGGLVRNCFVVLVLVICLTAIWAFGYWLITRVEAKLPKAWVVEYIWHGFFGLVGLVVMLNFLLSLIGYGFIAY